MPSKRRSALAAVLDSKTKVSVSLYFVKEWMKHRNLLTLVAQPVCEHCRKDITQIYERQVMGLNELETKFSRLWTQCQRCQGSLHQDVLCSAKDCPIFYMRKRVAKDLQEATKTVERFSHAW